MKHYNHQFDYRTYWLSNRSPIYDDTVGSYFAKLVKSVNLKMKSRFFNLLDLVLIIGFLAKSKHACSRNNIHERTAVVSVPHCDKRTLVNALRSRMCVDDRTSPYTATVGNDESKFCKLLHFYPKLGASLLMKSAKQQASSEKMQQYSVASIHPSWPLDNTWTFQSLNAEISKVLDKEVLNDVFIRSVNATIKKSLRTFAMNLQAD